MDLAAGVAAYRRHRFAALFATLLLTLGAGPTLEALAPHQSPLLLLLALILLAAVGSAPAGHLGLPLVLGLGFVVTRGALAALGIPGMLEVGEALWMIAIALATVTAVRHAFGRGAVDAERILAALDGYVLAGLLFGFAYVMVDRAWPGSFAGATAGTLDMTHAIYLSFVTIATLGYGDLVPVSPPARGLAVVESVAGQMYMTVLVARLVSLYARRDDA